MDDYRVRLKALTIVLLGLLALTALMVVPDYYSTNIAGNHYKSPAYHGWDTSYLEHGNRTDSRLEIYDGEVDGNPAIVEGYGCGRWWSTVDRNGAFLGPERRETNCNLYNHHTGEITNNGVVWGGWSSHN